MNIRRRGKVQPLLEQLCLGLPAEQLPAALQGLMASSALTRAAALTALQHVPCLAQGDWIHPCTSCTSCACVPAGSSTIFSHACTPEDIGIAAGACPPGTNAEALLWIARFDPDATDAAAAQELFATSQLTLPADYVGPVVAALSHRHSDVRDAAADALSAAIQVQISCSPAHHRIPFQGTTMPCVDVSNQHVAHLRGTHLAAGTPRESG